MSNVQSQKEVSGFQNLSYHQDLEQEKQTGRHLNQNLKFVTRNSSPLKSKLELDSLEEGEPSMMKPEKSSHSRESKNRRQVMSKVMLELNENGTDQGKIHVTSSPRRGYVKRLSTSIVVNKQGKMIMSSARALNESRGKTAMAYLVEKDLLDQQGSIQKNTELSEDESDDLERNSRLLSHGNSERLSQKYESAMPEARPLGDSCEL